MGSMFEKADSRKGKAGAFHRTYTGAKLMSDSAGAISFYIDMPDWGGVVQSGSGIWKSLI